MCKENKDCMECAKKAQKKCDKLVKGIKNGMTFIDATDNAGIDGYAKAYNLFLSRCTDLSGVLPLIKWNIGINNNIVDN